MATSTDRRTLALRQRLAAEVARARRRVVITQRLPGELWEFCMKCAFTFDERAHESGLEPERPFPDKPHLKILAEALGRERYVCVEKSRQIQVTWMLAAAVVHRVLTRRGERVAWRCKTYTEASDHIEQRLWRMVQMIPPGWALPVVRLVDGELLVYHDGPGKVATSRVVPQAAEHAKRTEAASQARSQVWSVFVDDESAFSPNQEELHFSALPSTGAMWKVSTPNSITFFHRLGYGDINNPQEPLLPPDFWNDPASGVAAQQMARGVWRWGRNGFVHYRCHYTADPDKDPDLPLGRAWYEAERQKYSSSKWAREMEIDSRVAVGTAVYSDFNAVEVAPQSYDPTLGVVVCWDFGRQVPGVVIMQVDQEDHEHYLHEIQGSDVILTEFAKRSVLPWLEEFCPGAMFTHFGDVAGNQEGDKVKESSIALLAHMGIHVRSERFELEKSIEVSQALISRGRKHIDPSCVTLIEGLRAGYVRDDEGFPLKDGVFDHPCDEMRYGDNGVFRLTDDLKLVRRVEVNPGREARGKGPPETRFTRRR